MMIKKKNHHLKGRIRDKVKQVILINGIPEVLYKIREMKTSIITYNNKKYRLDLPAELIDEFKKLPTIKIKESTRISKSFKPIVIPGIGHRTTIRAVNGNTHITVGAADEEQLAERIEIIRNHLTSLGITTTERCHWTCTVDKAKPNTDYQYTHNLSNDEIIKAESIIKVNPPEKIETSFIVKDAIPDNSDILQNGIFEKGILVNQVKKEMSEKTKSLHEIALKSIKDQEKRP